MKKLKIILITVAIIFIATNAFALIVGFNVDIHNGTGQDAYDFHIEGILKSSTFPTQVADFIYPVSPIPGFDWTYSGGTITPMYGNLYKYSGTWAGTTPVHTSQSIHVGKYFDETCHNVWVDVVGWWTDENGDKITGNKSDVPLIGFEVNDLGTPQTLMLQNATGIQTEIVSMQLASTNMAIPLSELVEGSNVLGRLDWQDVNPDPTGVGIGPDGTVIDLNQNGIVVPRNSFLVTQGYVLDPTDGEYHFFAHMHQAHVPEPGTIILILSGMGFLGLVFKRQNV